MLIVVLLLMALIGLGICALVAVTLWRAGRWGIAALAVLLALAGWGVLRSDDPRPEVYTSVFERETGLTFPASGEVRGHETVSDRDGTCTAALFGIAPRDAERLRSALRRADAASQPAHTLSCGGLDARGPYLATSRQHKDGRSIRWGISDDGRTLAFTYAEL